MATYPPMNYFRRYILQWSSLEQRPQSVQSYPITVVEMVSMVDILLALQGEDSSR